MSDKKVYIGTLYVGENELEECKESVERQTFPNITHEVFSYLPNKEAHDTLYSRFMELRGEYDYFIKLDADMVFKSDDVVERIVNYLDQNLLIDQLSLTVDDFYTANAIPAIHIFTKNCTWELSTEELFVDYDPKVMNKRVFYRYYSYEDSPILHSYNPYLKHAYVYGYHKAKKAFQCDTLNFDPIRSTNHWKNINEIISNYHRTNRMALLLAVIGSFDYISENINNATHNNYKNIKYKGLKKNKQKIKLFLCSEIYREVLRLKKIGIKRCIQIKIAKSKKLIINTLFNSKKNIIPNELIFNMEK